MEIIKDNRGNRSASLLCNLVTGKITSHSLWAERKFRIKFALRTVVFPFSTLRYISQLSRLTIFNQIMELQGLLPAKIHRNYLCTHFSVAQRAKAILDHYQLIENLNNGRLRQLLLAPTAQTLATFSGKNGEAFIINCCPGNFDREGEITLIVNYQSVNVALLSFSIIEQQGRRVLFIGGLQGARKNISAETIRDATKAAFGVFPKRLLVEVMFMLAAQCGVEVIRAVGDTTHVFRSRRYQHRKSDKLFASYDEFWLSLGGEAQADGLFTLPMQIERKALEEIASKKRAEYRRRYALMDSVNHQVLESIGATSLAAAS